MRALATIVGAFALCVALLGADAPAFTRKPTATKTADGKVKIEFAVSRETDVAVYVEDAGGKIIRHVAAGALGKNAPPPLTAGALAQSITWDGKDDDGRPVPAGRALRVRVGLGLKASLDGLAFAEKDNAGPNRIDTVAGLAVGPDGKLYMMDKWSGLCWWFTHKIHVFSRDGKYVKTIKPFPSDLPLDRVKAAGVFVNSFGYANPLIYRPEGTAFYPQEEIPQEPAITADGRIIFATRSNISDYDAPKFHVATLGCDGGVPEGAFDGPALKGGWASNPCLAVSGDGKRLYLTGVQAARSRQAANAVYTVSLPERSPLEVLFGEPGAAGTDHTHLSNPRAVAVDGQGHLLIADFGNNRVVAVNEKDKTFAGRAFLAGGPSEDRRRLRVQQADYADQVRRAGQEQLQGRQGSGSRGPVGSARGPGRAASCERVDLLGTGRHVGAGRGVGRQRRATGPLRGPRHDVLRADGGRLQAVEVLLPPRRRPDPAGNRLPHHGSQLRQLALDPR